ncbi:hypothetical protein EXIGLDRAFT_798452 [Exidia glandulosa HHB12029]|uniref:Uncharacterized protein n=1 Tax=Exidia glandulosa HHB12029 TaxID=1314781 RepID=A0A165F5H4_EXIGL|nr:hypothetical protein EXIGLDRAFT_798452 [Exidia glandulosa HHB12029]
MWSLPCLSTQLRPPQPLRDRRPRASRSHALYKKPAPVQLSSTVQSLKMSNQFPTLNSAADLTPNADYTSVSSVTLRPTPFLTWRDLQTIFSRCPNIRDLTIPSPGFQLLDLPSSSPFAPKRALHRLSLVYAVGNPLHDTSLATLWALPGVREIANVDIKLDWSQSVKQGTVEKVLGDLLCFVLSSFPVGIRAAHVGISDRDGMLDVRATIRTDRENSDEEVYDFRRTLRLFGPSHTDDATKAIITDIARTYVSYALRAPRPITTEPRAPHSPKPLSSVSHLRIPLSLVPSLSAHFNPHRPYFTSLEHLELDWDICPFHTESIVFPAWTSVLQSITIHAPQNRNVRLPAEGFLALLNLGGKGPLKLKLKGARIATEEDLKRLNTVFGQIYGY